MLAQRIKKLILLRLLFATVLLYGPYVFRQTEGLAFYGTSAAICVLSVFYLLWYLTQRRFPLLARVQILMDVGIESYLLYLTGGAESLFAVFYILSILSAALVLGEKKAVFETTAASCVGYFLGSLIEYREALSQLLPRDPIYLFYGTAVRMTIFIAVGYLSCYLSGTVLELQSRLKLSERLSFLGEVVSKIAHEVRNPLSSIRTAGEVLRDSLQGKLTPQEEKMLSIVDKESERLTQTLQRILNYAKQIQPSPKPILLDGLIERTLALAKLHATVQSNGIVVEKKYDPRRIHIYADEEQVLAAFLNLTLNAYQAMPHGGRYVVSAAEDLKGTKIDFEDSGGGIPSEKLKELFVPFKTTKKGGTGLGLAEVLKIVTLHEGKIDVESMQGKGTVFHLFFPKP